MTHNKRLTDKLMDIARWYSMPADHFNVVKEAVKILESAPSTSCSENPNRWADWSTQRRNQNRTVAVNQYGTWSLKEPLPQPYKAESEVQDADSD